MRDSLVYEITATLTNRFFLKESMRLKTEEQNLIKLNASHGGTKHGFIHNGVIFTDLVSSDKFKKEYSFKLIQPNVVNEVVYHVSLINKLDTDKAKLKRHLTKLCNKSEKNSDFTDSLPDKFICLFDEFNIIERIKPENHLLLAGKITQKEYDTFHQIIDYYNMNRLLY